MVFKRMRDWPFIAAPTSVFVVTAFYVIQGHPAYIPRGQAGIGRPGRVGPARARGSSAGRWLGLLAPAEVLVVLLLCVRRFAVVAGCLIGVAHRLSLGFCPARGCRWPRWRRLSRATGGSFRRKCAALLTGSGSGVRFRSEEGKVLNPGGLSGFSPSSARAAGPAATRRRQRSWFFWAWRPSAGPRLGATASNDQRRLEAAR